MGKRENIQNLADKNVCVCISSENVVWYANDVRIIKSISPYNANARVYVGVCI